MDCSTDNADVSGETIGAVAAAISGESKYTGVWLRIGHRFRGRLTEWLLAFIMLMWGAVVSLPGELFSVASFAGFRQVIEEETLGSIMIVVGAARLIGLGINGAMIEVTPHIRMTSAAIGVLVWATLSYFFAQSGHIGTWAAIYPVFALMEIGNTYLAAYDVGSARNGSGGNP